MLRYDDMTLLAEYSLIKSRGWGAKKTKDRYPIKNSEIKVTFSTKCTLVTKGDSSPDFFALFLFFKKEARKRKELFLFHIKNKITLLCLINTKVRKKKTSLIK